MSAPHDQTNMAAAATSSAAAAGKPALRVSVRKRKVKPVYDPSAPSTAPVAGGGGGHSEDGGGKRPRVEYTGKVETLADLIELGKSKADYSNINMRGLRRIREHLEELNKLVGLRALKETVLQQVLYYLQGLHEDSDDYMHTCIYGGPGTGKTTVAEILGYIFSNLGVLSGRNKFVVAQREDMVGQYLGHTAVKTSVVLEACRGGVLFLDEIYSFGSRDGRDSFSKECIDTINLFLSENKDDFMLIVGGYEKEVEECFFKQNAGLRRRFMWYHKIEPYTESDLVDIFHLKVREAGWAVRADVERDWLVRLVKEHKEQFKDQGGSIENFLTLLKVTHSRRIFGRPADERKVLIKEDIEGALKAALKVNKPEGSDAPPPMMYL